MLSSENIIDGTELSDCKSMPEEEFKKTPWKKESYR